MRRLRLERPQRKSVNAIVKLLLGGILLILLFGISYFGTGPSVTRLYESDISLKDVYAPYDFTYAGDIDEVKMKESEKEALEKVLPVFVIDAQIEESIAKTASTFFNQVRESLKTQELIGDDEKFKALKGVSELNLSDETCAAFIKTADIDYVEGSLHKIINQYLKKGILSQLDKDSLKKEGIKEISIIDPTGVTERAETVESIPTLDEFMVDVGRSLEESFPRDKKVRPAVLEVIKLLVSSNLQSSPEETKTRKSAALAKLSKIYKKVDVKKNELIIGKGEKVTKRHLKMLAQLEKTRSLGSRLFYLTGMALLSAIFLIISVFYLRFYESRIFRVNKNLVLISVLASFTAITAQAVVVSPLNSYLVPLASASMLIAILLDANSAFIFTIVMSIFTGLIAGGNFGLMIVMFVGGSVGIYSVRRLRRRSKLLLAGVFVSIANIITITSLNFLNNIELRFFLGEGILGAANGLVSFLLVAGLLPLLEYLFKIPTDITLLELSDFNHPLLKAMATNALGTYHHSLVVGNLAEAACDAIGANSLLARVGAYYHDIGKIEKAEYFSENEPVPQDSRHERLIPSMSALVIINHVKDGIELAHKYKLNQTLIDFIAQHHGNGLIYYFYQRALEKAEDEKALKEEDFRYPGPRPQTKETAIVLLADSVEASSRSLANPTPSRVQGLVQRIINNKFIDGQLDDCDLTLKDLHKISEAFTRVLNAMFHSRVEYPQEGERDKLKNARGNHSKSD